SASIKLRRPPSSRSAVLNRSNPMESADGDASALRELYDLLDDLIALRIQYGDGTMSAARTVGLLGATRAKEVANIIHAASAGLKAIIGARSGALSVPRPKE